MRALRGVSWMLGAVAVGTGGLILGAILGYEGAGPAVALACMAGALGMANRGLELW